MHGCRLVGLMAGFSVVYWRWCTMSLSLPDHWTSHSGIGVNGRWGRVFGTRGQVEDHEVAVTEEFVLYRLPYSFISPKHPWH